MTKSRKAAIAISQALINFGYEPKHIFSKLCPAQKQGAILAITYSGANPVGVAESMLEVTVRDYNRDLV